MTFKPYYGHCVIGADGPLVGCYVYGRSKKWKAAHSKCGWALHGGLQRMVYDTYYDTSLRDYWWNAAMNNARGTSPSAKGRNVYLTDDIWFNSERKDAIRKALPDATLVHYDGTPLKDGDMMVKLLNGSDQVSEVYSLAVTKHGVPDEKLDKSLVVTLVPSSVKDFTPPAPGSPLPQETVPSKTNLGVRLPF